MRKTNVFFLIECTFNFIVPISTLKCNFLNILLDKQFFKKYNFIFSSQDGIKTSFVFNLRFKNRPLMGQMWATGRRLTPTTLFLLVRFKYLTNIFQLSCLWKSIGDTCIRNLMEIDPHPCRPPTLASAFKKHCFKYCISNAIQCCTIHLI